MSEPSLLYLHPGQMEVFKTKSRFKVVAAGRRWGKSRLSAVTMIKYARIKKRLIWYVAPSYRMAKDIMWPVLLEEIPRKWIKKINETAMSILLINGTRIVLKGADNKDSLRGVGIHYLVMDEIQDIDPEAWYKVLRPTLASTGGHALMIGTSKGFNLLYELYMLGQKEENQKAGRWYSWQFETITSPFIPPEEIEAAKADMDPKSFQQEFQACHLPETEVLLADGKIKQVAYVNVGDVLLYKNDEGVLQPCVVKDRGLTGVKTIIDARLETGEIVSASNNHKYKIHA